MSHKTKTQSHTSRSRYLIIVGLTLLATVSLLLTSPTQAQVSTLQNNCLGTGGLSAGLTTFLNTKFVSNWTTQNKCLGDVTLTITASGDLMSGNLMQYSVTVINNGPRWSYGSRVTFSATNGLVASGSATLSYGQMAPNTSQTLSLLVVKSASTSSSLIASTATFTVSDPSITDTNGSNNVATHNTYVKGSTRAVCYSPALNIPSYECDALMDLYFSTNGSGRTSRGNWGTNTDAETWFGVTLTTISGKKYVRDICMSNPVEGTACNYQYLGTSGNNMVGPIPSSIGVLSQLTTLALNNNALGGTIPNEFTNLTKAYKVLLATTNLTGTLPSTIGSMTSLTEFDISYNNIGGALPAGLATTSLTHLWANGTKFTSLPDLSARNRYQLQLGDNLISGPLPSWIGAEANLNFLRLSNNSFSGPIPSSWNGLVGLTVLYLSNNELTGSLDVFAGLNVSAWTRLSVENNNFDRDHNNNAIVPANIQARLSAMTSQNLTNQGDVTAPTLSGTGVVAQTVDGGFDYTLTVRENSSTTGAGFTNGLTISFTGAAAICQQALLTVNKILTKSGATIIEVVALEPVTYTACQIYVTDRAGLRSNLITLPTFTSNEYGICNTVTDIMKADCKALVDIYYMTKGANWTNKTNWRGINDATPTTACDWFGITCGGNRVTSVCLNGSGSACNGSYATVGNNLVGIIPDSIGNLTGLITLMIQNNGLTGTLPPTLQNVKTLDHLYAQENDIGGTLPNLSTGLLNIYLGGNELTGSIPASWCDIKGINQLYLPDNSLNGQLPDCLNAYTNAYTISLQGNDFTGPLPTSRSFLTGLQVLRLNDNNLSGPIPSSWGSMVGLTLLRLDSNNLQGFVPASLTSLTSLPNSSSNLNNNCLSTGVSYMSAGLVTFLNNKFNNRTSQKICKGTIGSRIWLDTDNDGLYDNGETGTGGVTVTLKACTDQTPVNTGKLLNHELTAYYTFDDATGADDSLSDNTAVVSGVSFTDGVMGAAANFVGGLRYILKTNINNFPTSQLTAAMWLKKNNDGYHTFVSYVSDARDNDVLFGQTNSGSLEIWFAANRYDIGIPSIGGFPVNQRTHFAVTYNTLNGEIKLYKNGVLVHTGTHTTARGKTISPNGALSLGAEQDAVAGGRDPNQVLNGQMDDMRIYSRVLSATEISQLYNIDTANTPSNLSISYAGATVASTTTATNGSYSFTNVTGGKYYIEYSNIPNGYKFTTQNRGGYHNSANSTANPWSAKTSCFELYNGQNEIDINAGFKYLPYSSCENTLPNYTPILLGEPVTLSIGGYGVNATIQALSGSTVALNQNITNQGTNWALKTWSALWTPTVVATYTISGAVDGYNYRYDYYQSVSSASAYKVLGTDQRCAVQANMGPTTTSLTTINQIATIPSPVSYCTPSQIADSGLPYAASNNQPPKMLVKITDSCISNLMVTDDVTVMCDYVIDMNPSECKALVSLFTGTNGTSWTAKTNWNFKSDTNPRTACDWYGVTCVGGRVTALDLSNNNLSGSISGITWNNLPNIITLNLYDNNLNGLLPTTFAQIPGLQVLRLGVNNFTGTLPISWGVLSGLTDVNLYTAGTISGTIPQSWASSTGMAKNLVNLHLGGTLTVTNKPLPQYLSGFTKLQELYLYGNKFEGMIPSAIYVMTGLKTLQLNSNNLYGDLSKLALTGLTNLYTNAYGGWKSDLRGNCFYTGGVTASSLVTTAFLDDRFKWTTPSPYSSDWRQQVRCNTDLELTTITKSGNLLTGLLMTYVVSYKNLGSIPAYAPKLSITLHSGLYLMSGATVAASGSRPYIVSLPSLLTGQTGQYVFTISKMGLGSGLHSIVNQFSIDDISITDINPINNSFTDNDVARGSSYPICIHPQISVQTYECESLGDLYYWTNGPSWTTDTNWLTSTNVETWHGITLTNIAGTNYVQKICLGDETDADSCNAPSPRGNGNGNNLVGTIPFTIGYLSEVDTINLSQNMGLTGALPPDMTSMDKVVSLRMYNTRISNIGTGVAGMSALQTFTLTASTGLTSLPSNFGQTPTLRYLHLMSNGLTSLPDLSGLGDTLYDLNLQYNPLNTVIPAWLSGYNALRYLDMSYTQLTGSLGTVLNNLPELLTVSLANNNLTGALPALTTTRKLQSITLATNKFVGPLLTGWSSLSGLQTLNLSNNPAIESTLPAIWSGMRSLKVINLSGTQIEGEIPSSWFPVMTGMTDFIMPNMELDGLVPIGGFQNWTLLKTGPITSTVASNCMYTGFATAPQQTWMDTFWSWRAQKKCNADLQITMSKSGTDYNPGKIIVYTITYRNNGPRWSYLPQLNINLNTGVVLSGTSSSTTGISLGYLAPGASGQYIVTAVKRGTGQGTGIYTNTFTIGDTATIDTITGNNVLVDTGIIKWFKYNECIDVNDVPQTECEALMDIYTYTSGSGWTTKTNWAGVGDATEGTLCDWYGVYCTAGRVTNLCLAASTVGNSCLNAWSNPGGNNLSGTLQITLGDLTELTGLFLGSNKLTGPIPPQINNLTKLINLSLGSNKLTGPIPSMTGMQQLLWIYLHNNTLNTAIPSWIGQMSNLNGLVAYGSQLTGILHPSWTGANKLRYLSLSTNNFSASSLPVQWSTWTSLREIYLSTTQLTGTLPTSWSVLTGLTVLSLNDNNLNGTLPDVWSGMRALTSLGIGMNNLTGTLPTSWSALTALTFLQLNNNTIAGTLPTSWSALTNMDSLNVGGNNLQGTLPASWGSMTKLKTLRINSNSFLDDIPSTWFTGMRSMQALIAFDNDLGGPIDTPLWQNWTGLITNGADSVISNNCLYTGTVVGGYLSWMDTYFGAQQIKPASSWAPQYYWKNQRKCPADLQLTGMTVTGNLNTGAFMTYTIKYQNNGPSWAYTPTVSVSLYTGLETLSGSRTASISLGYLRPYASGQVVIPIKKVGVGSGTEVFTNTFVISDAVSDDSIPANNIVTHTGIVRWFKYQACVIVQDIPQTECEALGDFYTSTNGSGWTNKTNWMSSGDLTDTTACDWFGITCVTAANQTLAPKTVDKLCMSHNNTTAACNYGGRDAGGVAGNNLSGSIPPSIGDLTNLTRFTTVSNLKLVGTLPSTIGGLIKLSVISVMDNRISGNLPDALESLTGLVMLGIAGNPFTGWIPDKLFMLPALSIVHAYNMGLSGPIPLTGTSPLGQLYLNGNNLTGGMPDWITTRSSLSTLSLDYNKLSGPLPTIWTGGGNLIILNINNNQFTGPVPTSWSNLKKLSTLGLGNNTGLSMSTIPEWIEVNTGLVTLSLENMNLTGSLPVNWSILRKLATLRLNNNNLVGEIPTSWSAMTGLTTLTVANNNLDGLIPSWMQTSYTILGTGTSTMSNNCMYTGYVTGSFLTYMNLKFSTNWQFQRVCVTDPALESLIPVGSLQNGNTLTYTLKYINNGPRWTYNPRITVTLSTGLAINTATGTVISTLGPLGPNQSGYVSYVVNKNYLTQTGLSVFSNTFTIGDTTTSDSNIPNNTIVHTGIVRGSQYPICRNALLTVSQTECEALMDIYMTNNGSGWINKINWATNPDVGTWFGVTATGGRVTKLNLNSSLNDTTICSAVTTGNNLQGVLSDSIGGLTNLTELCLGNNQLAGALPATINSLTGLVTLSIHHNSLASVNSPLTGMITLTTLDLSYNQLSGAIDTKIGTLGELRNLWLNDNNLATGLPHITRYPKLQSIRLNDNNLTGSVPTTWSSFSFVSELTLHNNNLDRDHLNSAVIPVSLNAWYAAISTKSKQNQGDITAPVISSLQGIPSVVSGVSLAITFTINENSYVSGVYTAGLYSGQTLSGLYLTALGDARCMTITSDPIRSHNGTISVNIYPETNGSYANCQITIRDRANNISNTLTLGTFTFNQPPYRLHVIMGGSGVISLSGSLQSVNDMSPFDHQISLIGGNPVHANTILNDNGAVQFDSNKSLKMPGIFRKQLFNDIAILAVAQPGSSSSSLLIEQSQAGFPVSLSTSTWSLGSSSVAFTMPTSQHSLVTALHTNGGAHKVRINGVDRSSVATNQSLQITGISITTIGSGLQQGYLGEMIVYTTSLDAAGLNYLESYLALKYGITLPGSYTASTSGGSVQTIWSLNTGYQYQVIGLGRNLSSPLPINQTKSTSSSGSTITIHAQGNRTNGQYVMVGSNTGYLDRTRNISTLTGYKALARTWYVQKYGGNPSFRVSVTDSSIAAFNFAPTILVSNDPNFSTIAASGLLVKSGDTWVSSGVTINHGQYITFAVSQSKIGGRVWLDLNRDGIQSPSEPSVMGVKVKLWQCPASSLTQSWYLYNYQSSPVPFLSQTTTSTGMITNFMFNDLNPGNYYMTYDWSEASVHSGDVQSANVFVGTKNAANNPGIYAGGITWSDHEAYLAWKTSGTTGLWFGTMGSLSGIAVTGIDSDIMSPDYPSSSLYLTQASRCYILNAGSDQQSVGAGLMLNNSTDISLTQTVSTTGINNTTGVTFNQLLTATNNGSVRSHYTQIVVTVPKNVQIAQITSNSQSVPYITSGSQVKIYIGALAQNTSVSYTISYVYNGMGDDGEQLIIGSKLTSTTVDTNTSNNTPSNLTVALTKYGSSIGDRVWIDTNANGLQDVNEMNQSLVNGVIVELRRASTNVAAKPAKIVGPDGAYLFTSLNSGQYYLYVTNLPKGYAFTQRDTLGSGPENDSNINSDNKSDVFTITQGVDNLSIDVGLRSVNPLNQCNTVATHKLRVGQSYIGGFTDTYISGPIYGVRLFEVKRSWMEYADYNNSTTLPDMSVYNYGTRGSTFLGYVEPSKTQQTLQSINNSYTITRGPASRGTTGQMIVSYEYLGCNTLSNIPGQCLQSFRYNSCHTYEITKCGDGIVDTYATGEYLGTNRGGEACDFGGYNGTSYLSGGTQCSSACTLITTKQADLAISKTDIRRNMCALPSGSDGNIATGTSATGSIANLVNGSVISTMIISN